MSGPTEGGIAAALRRRERDAVETAMGDPVFPTSIAVARPWGGDAIARRRGEPPIATPIGESFELSATPSDPEAAAHPSEVVLADGSRMTLSDLLHACPQILGEEHVLAFGHELPLQPKLLDIQSLLSVQAHPPGHPELYVVLEAEPGASVRLGLCEDTDRNEIAAELRHGAALQRELAAYVGDHALLSRDLSAWLLGPPELPLPPAIAEACAPLVPTLVDLRRIATDVLERMHRIAVEPGTVIHNCVAQPGAPQRSATLHALGNANGLGILALEIRRAGPTLRAWDHGRLPQRPLDIDAALAAVPMTAARPEDFVIAKGGDPFAVDNGVFTAERVVVGPSTVTRNGRGRAELVHVCSGTVVLGGGRSPATLGAGKSALVPACWSGWTLSAPAGASVVIASLCPQPTALATRTRALRRVREIVASSEGPRDILAIANGGDGPVVAARFEAARQRLFRADGATRITVHEEPTRRGQLLGMIDAVRGWTPSAPDDVAIGIMLPGQGTRLSPITQRLHGIKPFVPMPIRTAEGGAWMSAGEASLHSWVLVADALRRAGFAGIAWKWGDEPQLPSTELDALGLDLRDADAVRFGKRSAVTEDLARNKEWLLRRADGQMIAQLRRRSADALNARLAEAGADAECLVHIGSPALSHRFTAALVAEFGDLEGWLDIDGYLFEALTHDPAAWAAERERDAGLRALLGGCPDFYERARAVKDRLEAERGAPLRIVVIDCGPDTWWGDMGQLGPARRAFARLADLDAEGEFARRLAALDDIVPDRHGNRVRNATIPDDGSVTGSVVVDSVIGAVGPAGIHGAVVLDSQLAHASLGPGAVVVDSTVAELEAGRDAWLFRAVAEQLGVPAHGIHTTMPADPCVPDCDAEQWAFDGREDPSAAEHWTSTRDGNPASFRDKAVQMRQRERSAEAIEAELERLHRAPLAARIAGRIPSRRP